MSGDDPAQQSDPGRVHIKTPMGELDLHGFSSFSIIYLAVIVLLALALGLQLWTNHQDRMDHREDRKEWLRQLKEYTERQDMLINSQTAITRTMGDISLTLHTMSEWLWGNPALVEERRRREAPKGRP